MRGPRTAMKSGPRSPQLEKALAQNEDPTQPKINKFIKIVAVLTLKKKKKGGSLECSTTLLTGTKSILKLET